MSLIKEFQTIAKRSKTEDLKKQIEFFRDLIKGCHYESDKEILKILEKELESRRN